MCQDQNCESIKLPGNDCSSGCDNHGVCNSREHCHCDPGYAPPDCRGAGPGGSIDSNGGGQYPSMYIKDVYLIIPSMLCKIKFKICVKL